jgi:hypothetical protein
MRQVLALLTAAVFTLGLAGVALALGTSTGSQPGSSTTDTTKSTAPSGSTTSPSDTGKSSPGAAGVQKGSKMGRAAAPGGMRGQHRMVGEVTKIDHEKGALTLKTDEGDMELHFPPSALSNIKEGERVEVQMAIRPASAPGARGPSGKTPAAKPGSPQTKTTP